MFFTYWEKEGQPTEIAANCSDKEAFDPIMCERLIIEQYHLSQITYIPQFIYDRLCFWNGEEFFS